MMYTPTLDVDVSNLAQEVLTEKIKATLTRLLELIEAEAQRYSVPVIKTTVDATYNYESGDEIIVIIQWVELGEDATLVYWRRLVDAIARWKRTLPEEHQAVATKQLAVEVHPYNHDETL